MTNLYLFAHGKGSTATQRELQQEARELTDTEEPFSNMRRHIRAYEQEFRTLARLQPRRILKQPSSPPFHDVSTTQLPGLYS